MRLRALTASAAAAVLSLAAGSAVSAAPKAADAPLKVVSIDVEGGAATLYVTPEGHSLLIDTGWPAGLGGPRRAPGDTGPPPPPPVSSATRIAAAVKAAGLSRIDYLLITHYHVDHVGGVHDLAALLPIGTYIDHGPNRETPPAAATPAQLANAPATLYPRYAEAIAGKPHRVMKPGDTLKIDGLTVQAVDSDRVLPAKPLAGGGKAAVDCASATSKAQDGGEENPRSLGVAITFGQARILSLGDTTWDVENGLVCPNNLVGRADLMFTDNHGSMLSNSPLLLQTVRPSVFVINNGPTKGADGETLDTAAAVVGRDRLWQLHTATRSPDKNAPADQIANLADGPDAMNPLTFLVARSGTVTAVNPRNGFTKSYPKAPRQ